MEIATQAVRIGLEWDTRTGAVTIPVYQTATFRHPGLGQSTGYDYTRSGNPTRQALEEGMALLDGGARGFAYSSGMAAITSLLLLFKPGDHLVVTEDLYGGTYRLFEQVFRQYGLEFTYTDTSDPARVRDAIRDTTRALFVESLTNPLLKIGRHPGPRRALPRPGRALHRRQHLPDPVPAAAAGTGRRRRRSTAAASIWPATTTRSAASPSSRTRSWRSACTSTRTPPAPCSGRRTAGW